MKIKNYTLKSKRMDGNLNLFKPIVATTLALSLSAFASAENGAITYPNNCASSSDKCFSVTSNGTSDDTPASPGTAVAGSNGIDVIWKDASGWKNSTTNTVTANNIVVQYGDTKGTLLNITGANYATNTFSFTNSTFIGSVYSQQDARHGSFSFNGDGNYTISGEKYAMVGELAGYGNGSNIQVNFTNANMYGDIAAYAIGRLSETSEGFGSGGKITATFTANEGEIAKLKGNAIAYGGSGGSVVNLNFAGEGTGILEGDVAADVKSNVNVNFNAKTSTLIGNIYLQRLVSVTDPNTKIHILFSENAENSTIRSDYIKADDVRHPGAGIFIQGNHLTGKTLTIKGTNDSDISNLDLQVSHTGGGGDRKLFITDYDAKDINFRVENSKPQTKATITSDNAKGILNLDADTLKLANSTTYKDDQKQSHTHGQQFVIDYYTGSVNIAATAISEQGHVNVIRFRDVNDTANSNPTSSITIGESGKLAGNIITNGTEGNTLLQANTITIHGNVSNTGATDLKAKQALSIDGNVSNTSKVSITSQEGKLNVDGNVITNGGSTTLNGQDIATNSVYGIGNYRLSNQGTNITASNNFSSNFIGIVKSDGSGGTASYTNTITAKSITLNATGTKGAIIGGNTGTTVANNGSSVTLNNGNIAIFNNITSGVNTIKIEGETAASSFILGDMVNFNGKNNLTLSQTTISRTTAPATVALPSFIGNIKNGSGTTNVIFNNTLIAPTNILEIVAAGSQAGLADSDKLTAAMAYLQTHANATGNIISTDGTTNIVLRQDQSNNFAVTPMYGVLSSGNNTFTNIVIQGDVDVGANITYGGMLNGDNYEWTGSNHKGTINLIFAHANNGTDSFEDSATLVENNQILGITYKDGVKIALQDKVIKLGDEKNASFMAQYKDYFVKEGSTATLSITNQRTTEDSSFKDVITIDGLAIGTISALERSEANKNNEAIFDVTLKSNSAFFGEFDFSKLTTGDNAATALANTSIVLTMEKSSKFLIDSSVTLQSLKINDTEFKSEEILLNTFKQNNTIIDLGSYGNDNNNLITRNDFNLLMIGNIPRDKTINTQAISVGLEGENAVFRVYANANADQSKATLGKETAQDGSNLAGKYGYAYADRIIVDNAKTTSNKPLKEYIQILYNTEVDITKFVYKKDTGTETAGNIAVFTVKNDDSGNALINLEAKDTIQGFEQIRTKLAPTQTNEFGKVDSTNGYTTYFVGEVKSLGISAANQQASAAAMGNNYELYLANMNSLNKRMGELRNNANAQGVWARVFNGMQTSKFSLEMNSIYTTFQAGYDYAFGMEGANNYLGFALSYMNSITSAKGMMDIDGSEKSLKDSLSNGVELAIYNAYVQDGASKDTGFKNGLYSDTILKFSFMNNNLNLNGQNETYNINNLAITFSQEVGYRFLLGDSKEWFIDPQAELALGFLDQSNLKQKLGTATMEGVQSAILTLRGRVGSNFGYKFDKFTENKNFKSQLYVGTYFVGDYISGGDISLVTNTGSNISLSALGSTARFTMNVGTNFTIKDNHRIYFDFERSFGGKLITQYQVNLGYRYSFGENKKYIPLATNLTSEVKKDKDSNKKKTEVKEAPKKDDKKDDKK